MRFPLLRPRWIGLHLAAVLVAAACFGLGYWQYTRAQEPEKEAVTNPVQDLSHATSLGRLLKPGEYMPRDDANRAVAATGTFDSDAQLLAPAESPEGKRGYYVIVPLVTKDRTALVVNRGWVPTGTDAPNDLAPLPEGEVAVTGWLRPPEDEEDAQGPVSAPKGQVARISPSVLVNEWPYQLYDGSVTLADQDPPAPRADDSHEQPRQFPPPDPPAETTWNWKNLSYAAQWMVFGIAAIVFWVSLIRRELKGRGEHPAVGGRDGSHPSAGTS